MIVTSPGTLTFWLAADGLLWLICRRLERMVAIAAANGRVTSETPPSAILSAAMRAARYLWIVMAESDLEEDSGTPTLESSVESYCIPPDGVSDRCKFNRPKRSSFSPAATLTTTWCAACANLLNKGALKSECCTSMFGGFRRATALRRPFSSLIECGGLHGLVTAG